MGVTEYERHRLFTWFEEQMGQERASTLMDMLPTTGFGDLVTRHDLRDVETSIRQDLVALESRLTARFVGWLLASQAVTISVVGVLTSLR